MADSYPDRISAAEIALTEARTVRDRHYPGSPAWTEKQGMVDVWERLVSDLREESRAAGGSGLGS